MSTHPPHPAPYHPIASDAIVRVHVRPLRIGLGLLLVATAVATIGLLTIEAAFPMVTWALLVTAIGTLAIAHSCGSELRPLALFTHAMLLAGAAGCIAMQTGSDVPMAAWGNLALLGIVLLTVVLQAVHRVTATRQRHEVAALTAKITRYLAFGTMCAVTAGQIVGISPRDQIVSPMDLSGNWFALLGSTLSCTGAALGVLAAMVLIERLRTDQVMDRLAALARPLVAFTTSITGRSRPRPGRRNPGDDAPASLFLSRPPRGMERIERPVRVVEEPSTGSWCSTECSTTVRGRRPSLAVDPAITTIPGRRQPPRRGSR